MTCQEYDNCSTLSLQLNIRNIQSGDVIDLLPTYLNTTIIDLFTV